MVGTWKAMLCCPHKSMFPKESNVVETMFPKLLNTFPRKHWGTTIVLLWKIVFSWKALMFPYKTLYNLLKEVVPLYFSFSLLMYLSCCFLGWGFVIL
jgi:hypothetical protein